ncbi:ribonuclease H-like protein [Bajunvirus bajun]|uniref:Ribonuclease H-like protein n=1 Tax=Brevundimonas phage vB_BgoS-Bajun TaxID=2948594 RepID=A0A9E7N7H0_9CAUD|nr:ribonuclease H-like protein [Brevundimonas phage vB_BgoS-Bajun]
MIILGCDPGAKGAFALIDTEACTIAICDMPQEPGVKNRTAVSAGGVSDLIRAAGADHLFVELVHSSPQMGVASAFSFGRSLGIVHGAAYRDGRTTLTEVRPQEWKGKTMTPKDKNEARRRAMQLFPSARSMFERVKDDGRAEAAILAFYGCLFLKTVPATALKLIEFPHA